MPGRYLPLTDAEIVIRITSDNAKADGNAQTEYRGSWSPEVRG